jgi:dTMP kinase
MEKLYAGLLISLEGIDGSGKTVLASRLAEFLIKRSIPLILTKEPGGTPFGLQLRSVLQEQPVPLVPAAEYLLFAADRAQHIECLVKPSLQAGKVVISDRMADSSLVYQGFGLGLDRAMIRKVNDWVMQGIKPDVTLYLKVDYETARNRCAGRGERLTAFEKRGRQFTEKIIEGFDRLAQENPVIKTIDGKQSSDIVFHEALAFVESLLAQRALGT